MKKICLVMVFILSMMMFAGCSKSVGREELLSNVDNSIKLGETEGWVIESKGFSSADDAIQRLFKNANIDGTPRMYVGYQINASGIDYAFTVRDDSNVEHLLIVRQNVDKELSIVKDTTEFDLLDYFAE